MLTWILIIIVGGILGWLASIVMRTDGQQGILLNIVVGIVGPFSVVWCLRRACGVSITARFLASDS